MPNLHTAVSRSGSAAKMFSTTARISSPQAGETLTITCITCGMPSSLEWSQKVSVHPDPSSSAKSYYPFIATLIPPQGSVLHEDGSTSLCAFCHASLEAQWHNYENNSSPVPPKDRQYSTHYFICAVCCVRTYRKRVRALPFQEFPFLLKDRQPGSITLGDNPLAVVCLDCSETMWAQSAEYDRWGLPIQKRHFNWMARPPPPEDSMEATVARLPSGETQLPRISPIVQTFAIDPRKPNSVMSSLAQQKAKLRSNKADGNKGDSKEPRKTTGAVHQLQVSSPSLVPVVTVAPMASHRSNSTIRERNTNVTSNLTSSSALPKLFPVTTCNMQAYNQSEVPANLGSVGILGPPLYSFPGYSPYGWSRREIEHFPYVASLEAGRSPAWNWLAPQHPSDMIRYQSYLSSLENRGFESSLPTHVLHPGNIGSPPSEPSPPPPAHPPFYIPPPFLAPEFRNSNKNTSPIHMARSSSDEDISCHLAKTQRNHNNSSSSESSIHWSEHGSAAYKLPSHLKSHTQNTSVVEKGISPTKDSPPLKLIKEDSGIRRSAERENNIESFATKKSSPNKERDRGCSPANNRKLLPKKRKYNFEGDLDEGNEGAEPMDYSVPSNLESSTSISASEAGHTGSTTSPLPVDLSIDSGTIEKSEIPPNFKIAYLCNQSGSSERATASITPSPRSSDEKSRALHRDSVIVNAVQEGGTQCKRNRKNLEAGESGETTSTQDKGSSAANRICNPEEKLRSEKSSQVMSTEMESQKENDKFDDSSNIKTVEQDVISGSLESEMNGNMNGNKIKGKSEEEIEEFINETLEVFKRNERVRNILKENEVMRKIEFLRTLDLITLQDKSEIDLRKLISRHERCTLPPLKLRPESPQKSSTPDETFEKQIILATLEDATPKQPVSNIEQLAFMSHLKLKPASRMEKFRREQDWRLVLLEKILREKRDIRAKGVQKPWDNAVDLSKLLLQTGKLKMRRRANSIALGKLRGLVESSSSNVLKANNSIHEVKYTGEKTVDPSMKSFGLKPIINYPKYIPTYSIPMGAAEGGDKIHLGEKQNRRETTAPKCDITTDRPAYSPGDANKQTDPDEECQVTPICIPNTPTFNSVDLKEASGMDTGASDESKDKSFSTDKMSQGSDFVFPPDPIVQAGIHPSSITTLVSAPNSDTQLNGETKRISQVGPIIQGYNASWLKTKIDIEEILISAKHLDKKSRKMAAYEMKRLRKTLLLHQFEIKSLEKKLKIREREIQAELGTGGKSLYTKARLG